MLSPWSRAGQQVAAACPSRCSVCRPGFIGRLQSWATKFQTKRYHNATFLYSAIFTGAALLDGSAKVIRCKQWEITLAKAKEEVESIEKIAEDRACRLLAAESSVAETVREGLRTSSWEDQDVLESFAQELGVKEAESQDPEEGPETQCNFVPLSIASVMKYHVEPGALRPQWPQATVPIAGKWGGNALPPPSLWSSDTRRVLAAEHKWSAKKICIVELEVMRLILNLLIIAGLQNTSRDYMISLMETETLQASPDRIQAYAQFGVEQQQRLRDELDQYMQAHLHPLKAWEIDDRPQFPLVPPNYKGYLRMDTETTQRRIKQLNYGLYRIFDDETGSRNEGGSLNLPRLILRVCDRLLRSSVPPSADTLNVLLLGFEDVARDAPNWHKTRCQIVGALARFRRRTPIRVNELYCAGILRHYRQTGKVRAFMHFIGKMRGQRGGLMLARRDILINQASNRRLERRENGKVVQAAHPMPVVFTEMIKGVLQFSGFDQAMEICNSLKDEGWGMDWRCLKTLMYDCVKREHWEDGRLVWDEMLALAEITRDVPYFILGSILALCRVCNQQRDFEEVFEEAFASGYNVDRLAQGMEWVMDSVRGQVIELGPRGYTRKVPPIPKPSPRNEELAEEVRKMLLRKREKKESAEPPEESTYTPIESDGPADDR